MEDKTVLKGLIEIYQNDFMCGYEGEDKEKLRLTFLELIVEVTRYANDFRYCSKKDCLCSPEKGIKRFAKDELIEKVLGGKYGLSDVPLSEIRKFLNEFKG